METETYKNAKLILERFDPEAKKKAVSPVFSIVCSISIGSCSTSIRMEFSRTTLYVQHNKYRWDGFHSAARTPYYWSIGDSDPLASPTRSEEEFPPLSR